MKKIIFIFLTVFELFVFNLTQASAGCKIVITGSSFSMPTQETSRTPQAAQELYSTIENEECFPIGEPTASFSNNCYGFATGGMRSLFHKWVCTDGPWEIGCEYYCGPFQPTCSSNYSGNWDVVCDNATTTILQTTTTTSTPATLINLSSFTATPKFSKVIIQWITESETDNAGFNIYRSESENGNYTKINTSLIPAKGSSTQGASYEFIDIIVQNRKTYYYKLEDIDLNGTSTMHGPVSATPRLIYGIGK
jgi:hypothetical protein